MAELASVPRKRQASREVPAKVALFVWGMAGGAFANVASALAGGFLESGVKDVYIVYLHAHPGDNVAIPENAHLVCLNARRSATSVLALAKFLRRTQPDYLISMVTIINMPAILGWWLGGKNKTKLIVSEHATMSYKVIEHKREFRFRIAPLLARLLYPKVSGVHANSQKVLDDLTSNVGVSLAHDKTAYIPNPVDIEAIREKSHASLPDENIVSDGTKLILLTIARLAEQKNYPLLLRAFKIIKQHVDAKLLIVGEGPERIKLEALITELELRDVELLGFKENPWQYMATADVFVLPSEEESFGLVLVEAMACDLPIVATDALGGGPRSVLDGGKCGLLVPRDKPEALAKAVLALLKSPQLQQKLVEASRKRYQTYTPKRIAEEWLKFFRVLEQQA